MTKPSRKTLRELAERTPPLQTSLALSPYVQRAVREWASQEEEAQRARIRVLGKYPRAYCGSAPYDRKAIYVPGPPSQRLSALCETEAHAWISAGYVVRE